MNILEKLKDHIIDIVSIFILVLAVIFAFDSIYYNPLIKYNHTITILSDKYQKDEVNLYKQLNKVVEKKDDNVTTLDTVPKLLTRINNTCKAPKVVIRTLKPDMANPFVFELQFIANYFDFLRVLSEFEKLNIIIHKIDIKPYEIKKNNSKHIITLNIEAVDGGERLSQKDVVFLQTELNKKRKRDPFQRFAKVGTRIKRLVDLTWMYKLSGIGKVDGKYVATINHRIYYNKSTFNGMRITNITPKGVLLQKYTSNGVVNYILKFRQKGTNEKK